DGEKTVIKMKTSVDRGAHWSEGRAIATTMGPSDYPLLLDTGDGRAMLAWHTNEEGFRLFDTGGDGDPGSGPSAARTANELPLSLQAFDAGSFDAIREKY